MSWISLAAARYEIREILGSSAGDKDYEKSKFTVVDAADGRDALLAGEDKFIKGEIKRAEYFLEKYENSKKPPHPTVMSQILNFAVIASLGEKDYSEIFELIAKAKNYRNPWEKTLQLIAKRIVKEKASPQEPYKKKGHVKKEKGWFKLVEKAPAAHSFNLAVCPDHIGWSLMCSYVLPLAFLWCQERKKDDWKKDMKELLRWGGPYPEEAGKIIYERTSEKPKPNSKVSASDKSTWRGFDAVEIKDNELYAYYYLGSEWKSSSVFPDKNKSFLDYTKLDWKLVKENIPENQWEQITGLKEKCVYVIVYDAARCSVTKTDLAKAEEHYDLNLITRDITEI